MSDLAERVALEMLAMAIRALDFPGGAPWHLLAFAQRRSYRERALELLKEQSHD